MTNTALRPCCFALVLSILLLLRDLHLVGGTNHVDDDSDAFPRVYSALVPEPSSYSILNITGAQESTGVPLTAQADVLGVWERGVVSTDRVNDAKFTRIAFLVHTASELERLEGLISHSTATNPYMVHDMTWEVDETQRMQKQARYTGDEHYRLLQEQPFDTIEGFGCYKNLQGSFDWIDAMVERATANANLTVEKIDIGSSYLRTVDELEGYRMYALKVTGTGAGVVDKGIMMTLSGLHAREYTPPELVSRWIEGLVDGYGVNASITSLLDQTEIYAILQGNPDGRFIAETQRDEYRRKNLNPVGNCDEGDLGVDLNRNFPFQWGLDTGSSGVTCSEVYRGESAASEPETQAIIEFALAIFPEDQRKEVFDEAYPDTVKGVFMDIHAFGEVVLWPWDYANLPTPNQDQFQAIASKMQFLNDYGLAGPGENFFGASSGSTGDFGYTALGAASFVLELGTDFYESCDYFLNNILPGNVEALTYAASIARAPFRLSQGPDILDVSVSLDSVSEGVVVIEATASDSARSTSTDETVQQSVDFIEIFVDEHPDARIVGEAPIGLKVSAASLTSPTTGSIVHILGIDGLSLGRHTVYVRATDEGGFEGPVSAVWFDKTDSKPNAPVAPVLASIAPIVPVAPVSPGNETDSTPPIVPIAPASPVAPVATDNATAPAAASVGPSLLSFAPSAQPAPFAPFAALSPVSPVMLVAPAIPGNETDAALDTSVAPIAPTSPVAIVAPEPTGTNDTDPTPTVPVGAVVPSPSSVAVAPVLLVAPIVPRNETDAAPVTLDTTVAPIAPTSPVAMVALVPTGTNDTEPTPVAPVGPVVPLPSSVPVAPSAPGSPVSPVLLVAPVIQGNETNASPVTLDTAVAPIAPQSPVAIVAQDSTGNETDPTPTAPVGSVNPSPSFAPIAPASLVAPVLPDNETDAVPTALDVPIAPITPVAPVSSVSPVATGNETASTAAPVVPVSRSVQVSNRFIASTSEPIPDALIKSELNNNFDIITAYDIIASEAVFRTYEGTPEYIPTSGTVGGYEPVDCPDFVEDGRSCHLLYAWFTVIFPAGTPGGSIDEEVPLMQGIVQNDIDNGDLQCKLNFLDPGNKFRVETPSVCQVEETRDENSPTATPVADPTWAPVLSPASMLMETPVALGELVCRDSPDELEFFVPTIELWRTCTWLSANIAEFEEELCAERAFSFYACPFACGRCSLNDPLSRVAWKTLPCKDSEVFEFYVDEELGMQPCSFLRTNNGWREMVCAPEGQAHYACPRGCRLCS